MPRTIPFLLLLSFAWAGCNGRPPHDGAPSQASPSAPDDTASPFAEPPFRDITREAGLDFRHDLGSERRYFFPEIMSPGAALLDYDRDGDLDIYLINGGSGSPGGPAKDERPPRNRLFRQESSGRFVDVTEDAGLGDPGYGMGVAVGDVNNDGYPDIYVTNYGADRLYLNGGDGTFTDITEQAGIDNRRWSASACFVDIDRDGWLDLFVTNYVDYQPYRPCIDAGGRLDYCNPAVFPRTPDTLFHNRTGAAAEPAGTVRFADVSLRSGVADRPGAGLGVLAADLTGDAWPDIYVANDGHANHFWVNQRDGTFRDEAVLAGTAFDALGQGQASMGIATADLNEDGAFDLLLTHLEGENNAVYLSSHGSGSYREASVPLGLSGTSLPFTGFGTAFVDVEHDGDVDLAVVNGRVRRATASGTPRAAAGDFWSAYAEPNQLFWNTGAGRFRLVALPGDPFSERLDVSRALACGDIDNDGDVDMLISNTAGSPVLLRNEAPKQGHWLSVRATDPRYGGRDAYGARVTITAGERQWHGLVAPGASYLASHDPRVHFGLGAAERLDRIEILWPDGQREVFFADAGTPADQFLELERGGGVSP